METIVGGIIALLNLVILFEINRLNEEIVRLRTLSDRITKIETEIRSCPSCRESTGIYDRDR
jgi:hypothetical protein